MLLLRRGIDHGARDGPALGLVNLEQQLTVADPLQGIGEFPAQIDGILDARVHALAAGRRMDMGGVSGDEAAPDAVVRRQSLVDAEDGQPAWIPELEAVWTIMVDAVLHLVQGCRFFPFGRVSAAHGEDAPHLFAEGKHRDGAAVVPPQIDAAVVEIAAVDLHVGQQECLRFGIAFEVDVQRLANGAARAVAAGQVSGRDGLASAIGMMAVTPEPSCARPTSSTLRSIAPPNSASRAASSASVRDCGSSKGNGKALSMPSPTARVASRRSPSPTQSAFSRRPSRTKWSTTPMPCSASRLALHRASALETLVGCAARSMMRTAMPWRRKVMASDR